MKAVKKTLKQWREIDDYEYSKHYFAHLKQLSRKFESIKKQLIKECPELKYSLEQIIIDIDDQDVVNSMVKK